MARDIPMDRKLSKEDRAYLRDRGAWGTALEGRLDATYGQDPASMPDDLPAAGQENVDLLVQENASLRAQVQDLQNQLSAATPAPTAEDVAAAEAEDEDEDDVPPYESWLLKDLQSEVNNRNTDRAEADRIRPAGTTKADLAAALQADDEAAAA